MSVCVALIITHVDYESNAKFLQAFRRTDGLIVSVVSVATGLSKDALHDLMRDSMATHIFLIGRDDEIASCDDYSIAGDGDSPATRPSVGRVGPALSERSLDARRACVQRQIDKIIAHDKALRIGGRARYVGVAADESKCDIPLLTGCSVMTHAMSVLQNIEPRPDVFVSDGTRTWSLDDAAETPVVQSPLQSSDYVFVIGKVDTDHISVATPNGATPVVTAATRWEDACHPIVFAFVSGRGISSFVESVIARIDGPCALCVFEATTDTDHIQVMFTMWGILLSLRDAEDARLGDVVNSAVARTQKMMDIDCMRWTIRGDPCTRVERSPTGSFDAVPPGTSWCLVDIDGQPTGMHPLQCVMHCTTPISWMISFYDDRIPAQYDITSGIIVGDIEKAETATSVSQTSRLVGAQHVEPPSSLALDQSFGLCKSDLLRLLRCATGLCVRAVATPELHIQTTTGNRMRWTRLHTGNVDGVSGCIHVDSVPFQLTNVARDWYVQNSTRVVSWIHADEVRNATGIVMARALAISIVECKATFETVDLYVHAANYQWSAIRVSFVVTVDNTRTTVENANLIDSVRQFIAANTGVLAPNIDVTVSPVRPAGSTDTALYIAASWVCLTNQVKRASGMLRELASNNQALGLQTATAVSDVAVTNEPVDFDGGGIVGETNALHTVVNMQLKANYPTTTLFPDLDATHAWLSEASYTIASRASVSKSRLQLSILFTSNPYIFVFQIITMNDAALAYSLPILRQVLSEKVLTLPMNAKYEVYEVELRQSRTTALTQPLVSTATQFTYTAPPDVIYSTYDLLAKFKFWIDSLAPSVMVSPDNLDLQVTVSFDLGQIRVQIGTRNVATGSINTQIDVKQVLDLPTTVVLVVQTSIPPGTFPLLTDSVPSNNDGDIIIDNEIMPLNEWCMCAIVSTSFIRYIDRIRHIYMQDDADGRFTLIAERNASVLSAMLYKKVVWIFFV